MSEPVETRYTEDDQSQPSPFSTNVFKRGLTERGREWSQSLQLTRVGYCRDSCRLVYITGVAAVLLASLTCLSGCSKAEPAVEVVAVGSRGAMPGRFRYPRAVAVRPDGGFYVVDRSGRIQRFDPDGAFVTQWYLPAYENGQPVGLEVERDAKLLVSDSHYNRILRYSENGEDIVASWGEAGTGPGQFTFGRDVVIDSEGYVYAGDYGGLNDRIEKFSSSGKFIQAWGGCGQEPGKFARPQGMAIERHGGAEFLLVADCANHRIQRFTLDGEVDAVFGAVGTGPGEFRYPSSVAVATDGTLLVSEWGNNRLQRLDRDGNHLGFWGRPGRAPGELATPWDVEVAADGRVFVVDYGNHRVQVFRWPGMERPPAATGVPVLGVQVLDARARGAAGTSLGGGE